MPKDQGDDKPCGFCDDAFSELRTEQEAINNKLRTRNHDLSNRVMVAETELDERRCCGNCMFYGFEKNWKGCSHWESTNAGKDMDGWRKCDKWQYRTEMVCGSRENLERIATEKAQDENSG